MPCQKSACVLVTRLNCTNGSTEMAEFPVVSEIALELPVATNFLDD